MKGTERRAYEAFVRVDGFGESRSASFAAGSRGRELFAELKGIIAELVEQGEAQASQRSAAAQETAGRDAARKALRASVEAIRRTAQALAFETPGLDKRFSLPRGNNDQALITTARSFLAEAEPIKSDFMRNELPADFLDTLSTQIQNMGQHIAAQNRSLGARVAATSAIKSAVARGLAVLRQLDVVVRNKFAADRGTLAAWESASHVERASRAARLKSPANAVPVTPEP
jgi:phosphoserine phosphatase